jgi:hypothetical protein
MGPKYEFTGETKVVDGHEVHRIRRISNGEIGGWIGSEEDLSQEGECWVGGEAVVWDCSVYEDAIVDGHAYVSDRYNDDGGIHGKAHIYGNAKITNWINICDNAKVHGNVDASDLDMCGNAELYGDVYINGPVAIQDNAKVYGNAELWHGSICDNVEIFGSTVVGYSDDEEEQDEIASDWLEIHGDAKISCGTINHSIDNTTSPSEYTSIKTITPRPTNIQKFLIKLIDSGLFYSNNDISFITTNLFINNSNEEEELIIISKDNNIKLVFNKEYDYIFYVLLTIIINVKEETIKKKDVIDEFGNDGNSFFKKIQWLHDFLVDMNYNEQYIRLLEL